MAAHWYLRGVDVKVWEEHLASAFEVCRRHAEAQRLISINHAAAFEPRATDDSKSSVPPRGATVTKAAALGSLAGQAYCACSGWLELGVVGESGSKRRYSVLRVTSNRSSADTVAHFEHYRSERVARQRTGGSKIDLARVASLHVRLVTNDAGREAMELVMVLATEAIVVRPGDEASVARMCEWRDALARHVGGKSSSAEIVLAALAAPSSSTVRAGWLSRCSDSGAWRPRYYRLLESRHLEVYEMQSNWWSGRTSLALCSVVDLSKLTEARAQRSAARPKGRRFKESVRSPGTVIELVSGAKARVLDAFDVENAIAWVEAVRCVCGLADAGVAG